MPSIRLTPLQPTTFDLWRDRVLTVPRQTLIQEVAVERDATAGSFRTLALRLVGEDDTRTLAGELSELGVVLRELLADRRGVRDIGIGESSAEIREALSENGAMAKAINDCAIAIANLDNGPGTDPNDPGDPDEPSEPGIPNADGMIVLHALDLVREPLLDTTLMASEVNLQMKEWLKSAESETAVEILSLRGDPWPQRYTALADRFMGGGKSPIDEDERRQRLGQLVALEFDVTHELFVGNATTGHTRSAR